MSQFGWSPCFMPKDRAQPLKVISGWLDRGSDKQVGHNPIPGIGMLSCHIPAGATLASVTLRLLVCVWEQQSRLSWQYQMQAGVSAVMFLPLLGVQCGVYTELGLAAEGWMLCSEVTLSKKICWSKSEQTWRLFASSLRSGGLSLVVPCPGMPHCCAVPANWAALWGISSLCWENWITLPGHSRRNFGKGWEISVLSGLAVDPSGQAMMRCGQVRSSLGEAAQAPIKSSLWLSVKGFEVSRWTAGSGQVLEQTQISCYVLGEPRGGGLQWKWTLSLQRRI